MGLLDRIERKTMQNWQAALSQFGYETIVTETHCGNSKTYPCNRNHICAVYKGKLGQIFFYRCAGELWMNYMGIDGIVTEHISSWATSVGSEVSQIANAIDAFKDWL